VPYSTLIVTLSVVSKDKEAELYVDVTAGVAESETSCVAGGSDKRLLEQDMAKKAHTVKSIVAKATQCLFFFDSFIR
jgi:hypothetical protein